MGLSGTEVEELFERLGSAGVGLLIEVDHARLATGEDPWAATISGPGAPGGGVRVRGCGTFQQCLTEVLAVLRDEPGDWE
ncbi:hypothetical protein OG474_42270 [Kribbella sp. NBC_01505]|uniref:hypothetical protein n=1 Tax=Kribbella sp. NBC_01505 TaxID=2903580 RepID=UPI003870452A